MSMRPEWSQRLLRKGVLVEETYRLFAGWDDARSVDENLESGLAGGFPTAGWEREVVSTLRRRLRHRDRMTPLIVLAKGGMAISDWRDCLRLWIGASEEPFHAFATGWLFEQREKGRNHLRSEDAGAFVETVARTRGAKAKPLSDYGRIRTARDLFRAAVDLGMLSGDGPVKTFASIAMSDDVTMFYAHMIADLEGSSSKMPASRLWRLAFLDPQDVHIGLLRLHQYRRLDYQVAGSLVQVGLPFKSAKEWAERLAA
jgi:hypothetical protein